MRRLLIAAIVPLIGAAIVPLIGSISASAHEPSSVQSAVSVDVQDGKRNAAKGDDAESILQSVKLSLEQAGLNHIELLQNSFLVRANDAAGNPVVIVVGPDSIGAVSVAPPGQTQCAPSTSGAAPSEAAGPEEIE
jgi:hypothetical protein